MTTEELQEQLLQQKEANTELQAKVDSLTKSNTELKESNDRLIDYNNKLFMRVGNQLDEKHDESDEEEMTEDEYAEKLVKEILEGEK